MIRISLAISFLKCHRILRPTGKTLSLKKKSHRIKSFGLRSQLTDSQLMIENVSIHKDYVSFMQRSTPATMWIYTLLQEPAGVDYPMMAAQCPNSSAIVPLMNICSIMRFDS